MELETIAGLPAHPLFAHLPVVLIPLAGIIAIAFAIRPAWLDRFGWGLVALTAVGAIGAVFAAGSGEALEEMLEDRGAPMTKVLKAHTESGEVARTLSLVFMVVVGAVVLARHLARRNAANPTGLWKVVSSKGAAVLMSVVVALAAAGATVAVADAGHKGAESVWSTDGGGIVEDEGDHEEDDND